jgi:hypothetical protein
MGWVKMAVAGAMMALSACTPRAFVFHGQTDVTDADRVAMESAADTIRTQSGVSVEIVWDGAREGRTLGYLSKTDPAAIAIASHGRTPYGWTSPSGSVALARENLADETMVQATTLHEMMHSLGVAHLAHGLMAPSYTGALCIDTAAMNALDQAVGVSDPHPCPDSE